MLCSEDLETMIVVIVTKIGGKLGIVKTCLLHHKITYMPSAFSQLYLTQIACRKLYLRVVLMEPSFNCFIFIVFTLITQKSLFE